MGRYNAIWDYFEKIGVNGKKAMCRICEEQYSYASTTGNLRLHLKKQHADTFIECLKRDKEMDNSVGTEKEEVVYEYVVVNSPASSAEESATATTDYIKNETVKQSRNSSDSIPKRRKVSQHATGKAKEKRLIEKLTEEKINISNLQKELIEKEMEEKNLKINLLQKELEFKDELYELERKEIEHRREEMIDKKQINELTKQEMLLKIEVLKATLRNIDKNTVYQEE